MTVYHHKDDIASTVFSPQNAFFSHQAKDWGRNEPIRRLRHAAAQPQVPGHDIADSFWRGQTCLSREADDRQRGMSSKLPGRAEGAGKQLAGLGIAQYPLGPHVPLELAAHRHH